MKEKFELYYSTKYPKIFQEGYEAEAQSFWDEIELELKDVLSLNQINYEKFIQLANKISRFLVNYYPGPQRKEMLLTLFFKSLIQINSPLKVKLTLMTLISASFTKINVKLKVKWQSIYEYLNQNLFRLAINHQFAYGGFNDKSWSYFSSFARKMRKFYPEETNREVLKLFKQFYSPLFVNVSKAGCYLYIFFRVSKSFSSKSYEDLLPELFELLTWKNHSWWIKLFLHIIVKIAWYLSLIIFIQRNHKDINWAPYYAQMFSTFFMLIKNEFPKKVRSHVEQNLDYFYKFSYFYPRDYINTVANIMVHLFRPESDPNSSACWEHFERIYQATLPFLHPENSGTWTKTLSSFYSYFARAYITRYHSEKQKREKFAKKEKAKAQAEKEANEATKANDLQSQTEANALPEETVEFNEENENGGEGADDDDNESIAPEEDNNFTSHLDENCHEKFLKFMIPVVKNFIFSAERSVSDNGSSLMRSLLYFKAEQIAPMFLQILYDIFDRTEFKHAGVLSLIYGVAYPLFKRSIYFPGIYELPRLLDLTLNHLVSHDMIKTNLLLWFYQAVFSIIPIFTHDDLRKKCKEIIGDVTDQHIKDKINEGEKFDMWKLTADISSWAVKFFAKFLDTFYYLQESTEHPQLRVKSIMLIFKRFISFIHQSSPSLRREYIKILVSFMKETDLKISNNYLNCIIISLNLSEPDLLMSQLLPVIKDRMLYKIKNPKTEEYKKKPLYDLLITQEFAKEFDFYELKISKKETLIWILDIVQGLCTLSSPTILKYLDEVKLIIFHCILHDENTVFRKALYVLHLTILSTKAFYPVNIGSFNPNDYTPEEFLNFYRKAGELSAKDCEPEWHIPNEDENAFVKSCIENMLKPAMKIIEDKYLKSYEDGDKIPDQAQFNKLTDNMLLNPPNISTANKKELIDLITFSHQIFLAVSQSIPYKDFADLGEMKLNFENRFTYEEYKALRPTVLDFIRRFLRFGFDTGVISEEKIAKPIIDWIGFLFAMDDQSSYLHDIFTLLKNFTYYKSDSKTEKFDSRLFRLMAYNYIQITNNRINAELQNKIVSYTNAIDFKINSKEFYYQLTSLCFHPVRTIASKSSELLELIIKCNSAYGKYEMIMPMINYTNSYVKDRFKKIGDNLGELEKKQVIIIDENKILKSIKDTYVDSLTYATQKITPMIIRIMPTNFEILLDIVENNMMVPKSSDAGTLERFEALLKSIDLTVYSSKKNSIENPIIEKSELFEEYEKSLTESTKLDYPFSLEAIQPQAENCLSKLITKIEDENIHWKVRTAAAILGLVFSKLIKTDSKLYDEFMITVLKQLESKHYYIRYMAHLFFSWIIDKKAKSQRSIKTTVLRSSEDYKNLKMTLEEAFEKRFILQADREKYYFKETYIGLIEEYTTLKTFNIEDKTFEFPKFVYEYLTQDGNINKIIERSVNDVQIKYDTQETNSSLDFKKIMQNLFNFSHKSQYLPSGNGDFQFFQGYFYFTLFRYFEGPKLVEASIETISNLSNDLNSREKHAVCSHYIYGVLRAMIYWTEEDRAKIQPKVTEIFLKAVENPSQDIFKNYLAAFVNFIFRVDYRLIEKIITTLLPNPFKVKSSNLQIKLLTLYECLVKFHGINVKKIVDFLLTKFVDFKPKNIKQAKEIPAMIITLLRYSLLIPVNYKKLKEEMIVDNLEDEISKNPEAYIVENDYFLYKVEPKIHTIFKNSISWIQESQNPEEKKIYLDYLFTLLLIFSTERMTTILYMYYEPLISFLLELDVNTISLATDTIEKLKNHISFLGKLIYSSRVLPKIDSLIKSSLSSPKFRVRENALRFYLYFYYNHIYYMEDKNLSIFDNLLIDENPIVRKRAFDVFSDFIKIKTKTEVLELLERSKSLVQKEETITLGLMIMMSLILGHPYENEPWTEDLIKILLKKHKINKIVLETFREFANKFWDSHKGYANINGISLSQETYYELREISSPYTYFA